jgi:phosphoribosylformylglycinamidine cyclo-ligase
VNFASTIKKKKSAFDQSFTYKAAGVDRDSREELRKKLGKRIQSESGKYMNGSPLKLPFGLVFLSSPNSEFFVDFQIEGVGTKTLLAEIEPSGYATIGIDAVAMAANDLIRSGARPMFVSDAIHIAKSDAGLVSKIVSGVLKGSEMCGAIVTSGETGDVAEILHRPIGTKGSEPFDLFVACCGFGDVRNLIMGGINDGDEIIGIESSGIHSNGLSLARRVLLRDWGGKYRAHDTPAGLSKSLIKELLEPTRIYAKAISEVSKRVKIKAAVHITGDGFGKFYRLSSFNRTIPNSPSRYKRLGFEFKDLAEIKPIFKLIHEIARLSSKPIAWEEMYQTFNMGYGFAAIVDRSDLENAIDLFNKYYPARRIGRVTTSGRIKIQGVTAKPLIL